jgi:hypothetical protein
LTSEVATADAASADAASTRRLRDRDGAFRFEPHHCFACGELNEGGLRLVLHTSPEGSWTETTLPATFQGWDAVAHGGIVCTLLDEVMAWSVIGQGTWGVTARLNVAFRRPISIGPPTRDPDGRARVRSGHRPGVRNRRGDLHRPPGRSARTAEGALRDAPRAE